MDIAGIIGLVFKGIDVAKEVLAVGKDVAPVVKNLVEIVTGVENGTMTDERLLEIENELDRQIEEFNEPIE